MSLPLPCKQKGHFLTFCRTYIKNTAIEVIEFVKSKGIEIRFSSEDSFRSDLVDLLSLYQAVDKVGVNVSHPPFAHICGTFGSFFGSFSVSFLMPLC